MIRSNFKIKKTSKANENRQVPTKNSDQEKKFTKDEFEEFVVKSGAAGSFMIFRSNKKEIELGLDEL